jgi:hypothetical protein
MLLEEQLAPASTLAEGLALAAAGLELELELGVVDVLDGVEDELLLQAASSDIADAPATTGSACRNRVLISAFTPM